VGSLVAPQRPPQHGRHDQRRARKLVGHPPRRFGGAEGGIGRTRLMVRIDHVVQVSTCLVPKAHLERFAATGENLFPALRERLAIERAFSQRAWTSTGLPMRGVTTQSPTLASIQVNWTPGSPAASSPSASR